MDYRTYIRRDKQELEVFGQVWDDGSGYWDDHHFIVDKEPEFAITELYDNEDREIVKLTTLTPEEIQVILDMFTQDYWDQIL